MGLLLQSLVTGPLERIGATRISVSLRGRCSAPRLFHDGGLRLRHNGPHSEQSIIIFHDGHCGIHHLKRRESAHHCLPFICGTALISTLLAQCPSNGSIDSLGERGATVMPLLRDSPGLLILRGTRLSRQRGRTSRTTRTSVHKLQ